MPGLVTAVTPAQGRAGTVVTVAGNDMHQAQTVQITHSGGTYNVSQAVFLSRPTTGGFGRITFAFPAGVTAGQTVTLAVVFAPVSTPNPYPAGQFVALPNPTIGSLSPAVGTGGTLLTLTGTNLSDLAYLRFGWMAVRPLTAGTTQAQFRLPWISGYANANLAPVAVHFASGLAVAVPGVTAFDYTAIPTPAPRPDCARRAWLRNPEDGAYLELEDRDGMWWCEELAIDAPAVRDVVDDIPDRSGVDDRTAYYGARGVSAKIGVRGGRDALDAVGRKFSPYVRAAGRPELHWTLDAPPGNPERMLTLRPVDFGWPISGARTRQLALQWSAPDPWAREAALQVFSLAVAGSATVSNPGDVPIEPLIRIFGGVTGPRISVGATPAYRYDRFAFSATYVIPQGRFVDVDVASRTVVADDGTNASGAVDWASSVWPSIPPDIPGTVETFSFTAAASVGGPTAWFVFRRGFLVP